MGLGVAPPPPVVAQVPSCLPVFCFVLNEVRPHYPYASFLALSFCWMSAQRPADLEASPVAKIKDSRGRTQGTCVHITGLLNLATWG